MVEEEQREEWGVRVAAVEGRERKEKRRQGILYREGWR